MLIGPLFVRRKTKMERCVVGPVIIARESQQDEKSLEQAALLVSRRQIVSCDDIIGDI